MPSWYGINDSYVKNWILCCVHGRAWDWNWPFFARGSKDFGPHREMSLAETPDCACLKQGQIQSVSLQSDTDRCTFLKSNLGHSQWDTIKGEGKSVHLFGLCIFRYLVSCLMNGIAFHIIGLSVISQVDLLCSYYITRLIHSTLSSLVETKAWCNSIIISHL